MSDRIAIPRARRETRDIGGRFILGAFLLLVGSIGTVGLVCWWLFPRAPHAALVPYPVPAYPTPQLQADPHEDMVRFYRQEIDRLNSLGWVDRAKGIVHIPIDQAMRQVGSKGIPGWPAGQAAPGGGTPGGSTP